MNFVVLSGNPKKDGLCATLTQSVVNGISSSGAQVEIVDTLNTGSCHMCSGGWGICRTERRCAFENEGGFKEMSEKLAAADAIAIVTPVYWQEVTEGLKNFMDRFRRCNFGDNGRISGKQVLLVASAGGSGNGLLASLEQLERFSRHTGLIIYDMFGFNRWNNDYKSEALYLSAKALASGRVNGDTITQAKE